MIEEKLVRGIGRWSMVAIVINSIIGAGIFGLPSKVAALIGSYSLVAFVICTVIIAFVVVCFAEVSSRFTETGGPYLYAKEAYGSLFGFEVGWLMWIARVTTFAANCNLLLAYLGFFVPHANEGILRIVLALSVVLIVTAVNYVGVRQSAMMTNILTVGKIVPLIVFAAVGLFFIRPANFTLPAAPDTPTLASAILILIYAFVGWESTTTVAGEMKDPRRNLPFALLTGLAFAATLYLLIQIVCVGTLPELSKSERPLVDAANKFFGVFGASFITLGALVSILGNLNGGFLFASRAPFAMAEQNELPQVVARTHGRFKTPYVSILLTAAVVLVFTIWTSFIAALTISTIARLIVYVTTCAALPIFRQRKDLPRAVFTAPFDVMASVLALGLTIWLLSYVDYKKEGLAVLILALVGLVIYFAYKIWGAKGDDVIAEQVDALRVGKLTN
jgi:basic amino acid/polyamine antiporter, APA family